MIVNPDVDVYTLKPELTRKRYEKRKNICLNRSEFISGESSFTFCNAPSVLQNCFFLFNHKSETTKTVKI